MGYQRDDNDIHQTFGHHNYRPEVNNINKPYFTELRMEKMR